ncbi:MAG TPA: XdhC family protein [Thermoanaerobaculia bacterium]|nr:XdhC family protein [Thermoanaerobaculia bacterium]
MNHWKESAEILVRLAELAAAGERASLATVVSISGSAYRRPGAKFLIEERGATLGSVSGGCLEADVREVAAAVLASEEPSLRHYNTGNDEDIVWGLGLGCNGMVEVFIQPATAGPLAALAGGLRELLSGDSPLVLATVVGGEGLGAMMAIEPGGRRHGSLGSGELDQLATERAAAQLTGGRSRIHEIGGRRVFLEVLPPPPHLLVCGAGDDARPLVAYAADLGFRVSVFDHRPALLDPVDLPAAVRLCLARPGDLHADPTRLADLALPPAARSLAVVKTHSLAHDREWVRLLLAAGLPYIGLLGPRDRTEGILTAIGASGDPRVFGPVGLDLGADGPRQVAVSIVAELLAFIAHREPRHLHERREAIHAR